MIACTFLFSTWFFDMMDALRMSPNLKLNGRSIAREAMQVTLLDRQDFKCRYILNSSKSTQ